MAIHIGGAVVPCLLTLALLVGLPTAGAFGGRLDSESPDATVWLTTPSSPVLCFLDDDGDGTYGAEEPVALHLDGDCATLAGALRLVVFGDHEAGRWIKAGDRDGRAAHLPFTPTVAEFKYIDTDANGRLSGGDALYVDGLNPGSGIVEPGDVRLTAFANRPGGVWVGQDDPDVGQALAVIGDINDIVGLADVNGNEIQDFADLVFLRLSGERGEAPVRVGDLRLGGTVSGEFGLFVLVTDADAGPDVRAVLNPVLCGALGPDAAYDGGETIVLRAGGSCADPLAEGELRIGSTLWPRARVGSGDADRGAVLSALGGSLSWRDTDGRTGRTEGDAIYLDVTQSPTRVDRGDLRLTPLPGLAAGVPVAEGDADHGAAATLLGGLDRFVYVDADRDAVFDATDFLYVDVVDGTLEIGVGDVRLFDGGAGFFWGSGATTGSSDVVQRLVAGTFEVCALDDDGDLAYDPGEAVYLNPGPCGSGIATNAVRLVAVGDQAPGSKVTTAQTVGAGGYTPIYDLVFVDADLSASWTPPDTMYLHFGTATTVKPGDIRLTASGAHEPGTVVASGDDETEGPVTSFGVLLDAATRFSDVDGDGVYSRADLLYADPAITTSTVATLGHVRLIPLAAAPVAPAGPSPSPDPTDTTSTPPLTTDPTESSTSEPPATDEPEDEKRGGRTPAPGAALVLLVLVGVLAALRRR